MSDFPVPDPNAELPAELVPAPVEALDIQHDTDPEPDGSGARRIPNLGHALVFFSLALLLISVGQLVAIGIFHLPADSLVDHPGVLLFGGALGYVATMATSFWLFPKLWRRSFLHGIQWNILAVHRRWFYIVPAAIAASAAAQFADARVRQPDIDAFAKIMQTAHGAWLLTAFGVLIAPPMEELAFRGFLLPALATAYDWLALNRTPAAIRRWQTTSGHTVGAVTFGAVFSSAAFALLHAGQLSHVWGAVGVLFAASLAFSYARIKTHSVACSVLMHSVYNLTVFAYAMFLSGGYRHLDKL